MISLPNLLDKAISFASKVIASSFSDASAVAGSSSGSSNAAAVEEKINEAISITTDLVKSSTKTIVDKIESDKLEELQARVCNIGWLLRINKTDEIFRQALLVRESASYARNRLKEGKLDWVGPCLMAKSAICVALEACSADFSGEKEELEALCKEAKYELLDVIVPHIFSSGKRIPWQAIESFLSRQGGLAEVTKLLGCDDALKAPGAPVNNIKSPIDGKILLWRKKVGDKVECNEVVCEVEAEKVVIEICAPKNGTLSEIKKHNEMTVLEGEVIAVCF